MDIGLARTFLEVASTGSFVAAADKLHITPTAVSARIRILEDQLNRRLFVRSRAGARLTPAGERFHPHATALVQLWERARQQVALPTGRSELVGLGSEISLWNPLLPRLLCWLRQKAPELALRAEVNTPERLMDRVQEGALDVAILYNPPARPDLVMELIDEEKLVMVTTCQRGSMSPADYIFVEWGSAFVASHDAAFPHLANPGTSITLGRAALNFMLKVGGSGYFRLSVVRSYLASKRLHRVTGAPEFSHSVHAVYSSRSTADTLERVRDGLQACTRSQEAHGVE